MRSSSILKIGRIPFFCWGHLPFFEVFILVFQNKLRLSSIFLEVVFHFFFRSSSIFLGCLPFKYKWGHLPSKKNEVVFQFQKNKVVFDLKTIWGRLPFSFFLRSGRGCLKIRDVICRHGSWRISCLGTHWSAQVYMFYSTDLEF
jgi:hypothetical protein